MGRKKTGKQRIAKTLCLDRDFIKLMQEVAKKFSTTESRLVEEVVGDFIKRNSQLLLDEKKGDS